MYFCKNPGVKKIILKNFMFTGVENIKIVGIKK